MLTVIASKEVQLCVDVLTDKTPATRERVDTNGTAVAECTINLLKPSDNFIYDQV
jgi:hypothetical protein